MDLEKGTSTLEKVDKFLTKFGTVLKNHWGKLILIGIGVVIWWFGKEILKEYDKLEDEPYYDEAYYDEAYYEEDSLDYDY